MKMLMLSGVVCALEDGCWSASYLQTIYHFFTQSALAPDF